MGGVVCAACVTSVCFGQDRHSLRHSSRHSFRHSFLGRQVEYEWKQSTCVYSVYHAILSTGTLNLRGYYARNINSI